MQKKKITKRQRKALKGPNSAVKASLAFYQGKTETVAGAVYAGVKATVFDGLIRQRQNMPWVRIGGKRQPYVLPQAA